eukprot:Rmarinus@m.28166
MESIRKSLSCAGSSPVCAVCPHGTDSVHVLNYDVIQPELRILISELHQTFAALCDAEEDDTLQETLRRGAEQMRASFIECVVMLEAADLTSNDYTAEEMRWTMVLWYLVEILYLESPTLPLEALLQWTRDSFTRSCSDSILPIASQIAELVCHGRFEDAIEMINIEFGEEPDCGSPYSALLSLLQTPYIAPRNGGEECWLQVDQDFKDWHRKCAEFQSRSDVASDPQLRNLANLLMGNEETLQEMSRFWWEHLVMRLLFRYPAARLTDLRDIMKDTMR